MHALVIDSFNGIDGDDMVRSLQRAPDDQVGDVPLLTVYQYVIHKTHATVATTNPGPLPDNRRPETDTLVEVLSP